MSDYQYHQNTHWYAVDKGFTSNPVFSSWDEIERIGLHDCSLQQCEEAHCSSAETFYADFIYTAEVARITKRDGRPEELREKQVG